MYLWELFVCLIETLLITYLLYKKIGLKPVRNYGCIIDDDGFHILISGDCAVANPELAKFVGNLSIDLALLDFPWVTLRKGREFIEQYIRPKHQAVYHLPFAENNYWGYREAAAKGAALLQSVPDVRLMQDPFQREVFD